MTGRAEILAGAPLHNPWLYRRVPFHMGDPMALITLPDGSTRAILRDIELDRFRAGGFADQALSPADCAPAGGLSGDRETATAQAAAELLARQGVAEVMTDRSLPMIFAHYLGERGVTVRCDPMMGVLERRAKTRREVDHLRAAQGLTEQAVRFACELIANAEAGAGGVLHRDGEALTSESVQAEINVWLLTHGMGPCDSIVAGGPAGADCHHRGSGPLRTETPIIVDIFPMHSASRYFGDCTRTVVHGAVPPEVARFHEAVIEAKADAIAAVRPGATGQAVHEAAIARIRSAGFGVGLPGPEAPDTDAGMVHGTGHGVGLEVHEPPLLDTGGPELVVGDCLTIEPGVYSRAVGGVRVEDMVIVTEDGCENLNSIPEGLAWA
ncbi:MAG: aminopeptidase P family protein [Planctomycetota bacterium]|nr:MAG: aminopeptidase P family protein [Planctomycetota bacterium]